MTNFIKFKNIFKLFSFAIFVFIISSFTYAKNTVDNIDIDVVINNYGMATITQKWTGDFNEGTEVYLPIKTRDLTVKNLHVKKDGREFKNVEKWNVNDSLFNKSYRCGLIKNSDNVEICFGISEYGYNTYVFSYDIDPLVKSYNDFDGFNFQFVNSNLSTFPSNLTISIRLRNYLLSTENSKIWAFGFDGVSEISNGIATIRSNSPLNDTNYANVMMNFDKSLLTPNHKIDGTFNDLIYDVAMVDSDYINYQKENFFKSIIKYIIFILVFISFFVPLYLSIARKNRLKKFYKNANYFRDTPNNDNISMSYVLFKDFDIWNSKNSNIIGAIIIKMINDNNLIPIKEKEYGLFGNEKVNTSLKIGSAPKDKTILELYNIIINAADDDGILQENELKKYAKNNFTILNNYYESIKQDGINSLNKINAYTKILSNDIKGLSDVGKEQLSEVYGLRKFLDEFTLISERSITESIIWDNLIVYATLFGIAKKVLKELKKLYPDKIYDIEHYNETIYISDVFYRAMYFNNLSYMNSINNSKMTDIAVSGLGGKISFGGGGGFSGGGIGGGTR